MGLVFRSGIVLVLLAPALLAQAQDPVPTEARLAEPETWQFAASAFYSNPPGSEGRLTPIVYADHGALHLELRHNYEDLDTTSFFAGWGFEPASLEEGDALAFAITPMLGVVAGDTDGIAPALEFDLGWQRLAWYTEAEYLFDQEERDDDFFYSWSTLTYGFTDWLSAGVVTERSKLVDTDLGLQRGLALSIKGANLGCSLYAYNLGSDDSYAVIAFEYAP